MAENPSSEDVSALLAAAAQGDPGASERAFSLVYEELHRLAAGYMQRERKDHTLQPTALVHEAFLRLVGSGRDGVAFQNKGHFLATAAVAMRRILVNHAKAKGTAKRGGRQGRFQLDQVTAAFQDSAIDLLALDEALDRLAELNPLQARLIELRFFGGVAFDHCAEILGASERSLYYEWAHARAWLKRQLTDE